MTFWRNIWRRTPKNIGLVLSGGGLRGIGHLGAIKALEEHGYRPSAISGCSAGAIIGAFYAAGYTVDEMLEIAQHNDLFPATSFRLRISGFLDTRFLSRLIHEYIPDNTFESLKIPLVVAATDILSGDTRYFESGPLDTALLASSSIPLMFPAIRQNDVPYHDGGILDNLPIKPLRRRCDYLIGVHVNALDTVSPRELAPIKLLDRVIHLAINSSVARNAKRCHLFIEPPNMLQFDMFGKKDLGRIFEYVYNYASSMLAAR